MKIEIQSKKGLRTTLSIFVDKKSIKKKLEERLIELQSQVQLKGFRPGKVPAAVIKNQFGKAVYGEVIDKLLKETSSKALEEKKIKAAGQPKIDLKTFGEGKDLNYELQVDCFPEIKLSPLDKFQIKDYKISIDKKFIEEKIKEMANSHKTYIEKKPNEKSEIGDQITFDYSGTIDGKKFEGSEGKNIKIELGKNLFLENFDKQMEGLKINENKSVEVLLPSNHPKKELANKKTKFDCKVTSIKKGISSKIDDEFAKQMGTKDLGELKNMIEKQMSNQYSQALSSISKKEIFDQLEKNHNISLPDNLVENEINLITKNLKKDEILKHRSKNEKLAKSRVKLGLILNEFGEKNNLKVKDEEIKSEIQKQVKGMPGQEKLIFEYYQKNPLATQNLRGSLYEEKVINFIKSKCKLNTKNISMKEADKILADFNKPNDIPKQNKTKKTNKDKAK